LVAKGFTIVELLIVIIVIAILAAITIASYNGITMRVYNVAVQGDLANIARQIEVYRAENDTYPRNVAFQMLGPKVSKSAYGALWFDNEHMPRNLLYCSPIATPDRYLLIARSKSGAVFTYGTDGSDESDMSITDGSTSTSICSQFDIPTAGTVEDRQIFYEPKLDGSSPEDGWNSWVR